MVYDRNKQPLMVGDCVLYHDCDEDTRDLDRVWAVDSIEGNDTNLDNENEENIIHLSDDLGCELEAYPHELEKL